MFKYIDSPPDRSGAEIAAELGRDRKTHPLLLPCESPPLVSGRRGVLALIGDIIAASEDMSS